MKFKRVSSTYYKCGIWILMQSGDKWIVGIRTISNAGTYEYKYSKVKFLSAERAARAVSPHAVLGN